MNTEICSNSSHSHKTTLDNDQLSDISGTSTASLKLETVELKSAKIWPTKFVTLNTKLESMIYEYEHLAKEQKWKDTGNVKHEDDLIWKTWNDLPPSFVTMQRFRTGILAVWAHVHL